jgi:DNA adenine methylase
MKYMGSKGRHAREILPIILAGRKEGQTYVEPFVGGANIIDKVTGARIGADTHKHLIGMWQAVAVDGFKPLRYCGEAFYRECSTMKGYAIGRAVLGYVGFAMSYGGKWFGGYRRDRTGKRDYADEAYRSALKQFPLLRDVDFRCCDYRELDLPAASLVYCDPPYADVTGYSTGDFDHAAFWQWCRDIHRAGHTVFVSEYSAPADFECVWSKKVHNTLVDDTGAKSGVEKLFTLR